MRNRPSVASSIQTSDALAVGPARAVAREQRIGVLADRAAQAAEHGVVVEAGKLRIGQREQRQLVLVRSREHAHACRVPRRDRVEGRVRQRDAVDDRLELKPGDAVLAPGGNRVEDLVGRAREQRVEIAGLHAQPPDDARRDLGRALAGAHPRGRAALGDSPGEEAARRGDSEQRADTARHPPTRRRS